MTNLDDRLRASAATVHRECTASTIPNLTADRRPVPERSLASRRVGLALAGAAVIGAVGIAVFRSDGAGQITTSDATTETTSPATVGTAPTAPVTTATASTSVAPSTVVEPVPEPSQYPSIDGIPEAGAPIGLGNPPDGFTPAYAGSGPFQNLPGGSGALALIQVDDAGRATGNTITVGVSGIPPYQPNIWDEGGAPDGALVTLGQVTGRWRVWPGIDASDFFTAPIDDQHRVTVDGTLPRDEMEDFIATISFGDDASAPSFDTPPGYVLVDTRVDITNGEYGWTVNYSNADSTSQFLLTTVYRPAQPLVQQMLNLGAEELTVSDRPAIASYDGIPNQLSPLPDGSAAISSLLIDVRPDLRVQISNVIGSFDSDYALQSLDLLALAEDLVAFTPSGWNKILASADARQAASPPYEVPACSASPYDVAWDAGDAPTYSDSSSPIPAIEAGWPVEVTITAIEGFRLDDVTLKLTNPGVDVELGHLDSVVDSETITITWDGIISGNWDGEPIPPARTPGVFNLGFDATAIDLTSDCEPQSTTGSIVDLYVVP